MWIQVRTFDGRKSVRVDNLSKLTTIEQLRDKLASDFDAAPDNQRLFYRGKQARWMCHVCFMILMNYLLKACNFCACVVVVMFGRYLFTQPLSFFVQVA